MAIGAILEAKAAGYRVPDDLGVMGFDDIPEATIISPALTIISRDLRRIGHQLAEILFDRIEGKITEPGRFFQSDWQLVIRDSIG